LSDNKQYLGDSVYAQTEGGMVLLTTEDGLRVTNRIYLEPEVIALFVEWLKKETKYA